MGEERKYKLFKIDRINSDKQWHVGAFICKDYDDFYLMLSLYKWDICIGRMWEYV